MGKALLEKFLKNSRQVIEYLENSRQSLISLFLVFVSAVTLRNFLEIYSDATDLGADIFIHYYLSYVALALALILLFFYFTKQPVGKIFRVILPGFIITNIVPLLDLLLSRGQGYDISYYSPLGKDDLLVKFLTFFGPYDGHGATPGIQIEVFLVMLGALLYFYVKKKNILKGLIFSFSIYCLIFLYSIIPYVLDIFLRVFGQHYHPAQNAVFSGFYLLLIFILASWVYFIWRPRHFIAIIRDLRPLRVMHFIALFFLGVLLYPHVTGREIVLEPEKLFSVILSLIAILFSSLFSISTNNMVDRKIDRISNRLRPLVSGTVGSDDYKKLAAAFFIASNIYALAAGFMPWFFNLLYIGNFYLYSMPPFRLKRLPVVSKIFTALNSYIMGLWGYMVLAGPDRQAFDLIEGEVLVYFLVFYTLSVNFIDIKDYQGDKKAGIKTLPVLLGLKNAKLLIGFLMFASYAAAWIFFKFPGGALYVLPALGLVQFYLVNRKNYQEWPIFAVYFITLIYISRHLQ